MCVINKNKQTVDIACGACYNVRAYIKSIRTIITGFV